MNTVILILRKPTWILGGLLLFAILLIGAAYFYFIKLRLPVVSGELRVKGLRDKVTVSRDRWGVPHIYAANEHDLFMAQGFVQAQERLWQMETNRRLASGRLSEIFGAQALEVDKFMRTCGFMSAAQAEIASYDESTMEILRAFADGVNACIVSRKGRLPIEFKLLDVQPEPWRPEDSVVWGKFMGFQGGKDWQEEIVRAMLVNALGEERAGDLLKRGDLSMPAIPEIFLSLLLSGPGETALSCLLPFSGGAASNNWVVHGTRTDTGLPLLANDMHLPLSIPCVWYEMHLCGGAMDVIGLSLPGVPLILAGHNRSVAWGITFAYTDVQDVFLERMSPEKEGFYLYRDEWLEVQKSREEIRVKGRKEPVSHEVWVTRHGPLISPLFSETALLGYGLALKWSGRDPGEMLPVLHRMNLAGNWDEFQAAAQRWSEPAVNLVYGDISGNIGYVLGSRVPTREQGYGGGPFPGWSGEFEWTGYVAPGQKPAVLNPAEGFFATANNDVAGPAYPFYLAEEYVSSDRVDRIDQVLSEKNPISKEDFRLLQGDFKCLSARPFIDAIRAVEVRHPEARKIKEMLETWDQNIGPDSAGGAVYSVLLYRLLENTFRDELGPLADRFFGSGLTQIEPLNLYTDRSRAILRNLLREPDSPWFDDTRTPEKTENLSDVLEKSLLETASFLRENLGAEPADWHWGELHRVEMKHLLGGARPLDLIFNLGPYDCGGHFCTVWQSGVMPGMDFGVKGWSVSNRHIYDLKNWDDSLGAIVPGQSGVIGSDHYADQVELWLRAGHHPLYYSRPRVEAEAEDRLTLRP